MIKQNTLGAHLNILFSAPEQNVSWRLYGAKFLARTTGHTQ